MFAMPDAETGSSKALSVNDKVQDDVNGHPLCDANVFLEEPECVWIRIHPHPAEPTVGYPRRFKPGPDNGAFRADYGATGSRVTNVQYDVDLFQA